MGSLTDALLFTLAHVRTFLHDAHMYVQTHTNVDAQKHTYHYANTHSRDTDVQALVYINE